MISRYILRAFPATLFICFAAAPVRPAYGFMLASGTLTHLISDLPGTVANALQYNGEKFGFKINGYGTAGLLEPDFETPYFINDWRVRGEINYHPGANTFGLVYAIDAAAVDEDKFMREGFTYWQNRKYGRMEIGFTDSVARKLGVGLPDVGGLRVNDKPLFYKKIHPAGPVIADTTLTTGRNALRMNLVSMPIGATQYGLSVAGITDDYDYAIDAGIKLRSPTGKVKTAYAFGASFMSRPDNYRTDAYTPLVNADWRAQVSGGLNLQYNSFMWGLTARVIYDENPVGPISDGLAVGTGISYDILNYSVSLTYIFSDTGIWNRDIDDYMDHTAITSLRYKYSENVDLWISLGITTETPFVSAGLRLTI
ncbi:MAG: hypothetical protein IAC69_01065 [Proteobacteria bacterium]|uniref:Uncharacterized protein n=1 Tax=Candidatus Enterousia avistercoris TaxID=2840788 RepID=A0A9D9DF91_9PROT|nr:hypothetical protein [Candidatus Enterousia avistercoris]